MFRRLLDKLTGGNTLYYPGCVTQYALPDVAERYETLLREAGVDFIALRGETFCCGSPIKRAGYRADFEDLKAKNLAVFARFSVRKVVTNCPGCYHTLKHDYGLEAYHASQLLAPERLRTGSDAGELTYHDPCHLGRWSGLYDEPRRLLAAAGWAVAELPDNRERSLCCGAGGGVKANSPELAAQVARQRLAQVENQRLCTACPLCYAHLREHSAGVEVLELSQALMRDKERQG
jgi:Fe-S oxidoreductase